MLTWKLIRRLVCLKRNAITSTSLAPRLSSQTMRMSSVLSSRTSVSWGSFPVAISSPMAWTRFALF